MAQAETFVLAAQIAAELHFATKVAEKLALTAKNAHAVSARAGQQASGFRAITRFIEDLAVTTIQQASAITQNAIAISMQATNRERLTQALEHFQHVGSKAADAAYIDSISTPTQHTQARLTKLEQQFQQLLWNLKSQLDESQQQIRAAAIISSTSKVEASLAGSFQLQLEVIAENIATAADEIKSHLMTAQRLLDTTINSLSLPHSTAATC